MSFASSPFLLFYVVVFALHWALPGPRARKLLLLAASYYFYMSWNVELVGLILFSTVTDYGVGWALGRTQAPRARRLWLLVSLVVNLGLLGWFKYAGFFADSLAALLASLGYDAHPVELQIILPVGISFYTFQTLSYSIDVYRRQLEPTRDLLDFALFVAFFPQLVAGPIVRASHFLPQLVRPTRWRSADILTGWQRMLVGLAKKVVLADSFALVADPVFADPERYGPAGLWFGVLCFALQIYCDFSAYSDIAIGAAATLGYALPENFDHPYVATNIREFWRRWHISLSTWLRDYLYIPLGGSRRGPSRTQLNLAITMLLGGLWHGAAWTFVAWGLLHGVALAVQRALDARRGSSEVRQGGLLGALTTFVLVCVGWVLFRAATFGDAATVLTGMLGLGGPADAPGLRTPVLWMVLLMLLVHVHVAWRERRPTSWTAPPWLRTAFLVLCAGAVLAFAEGQGEEFIYFQF